MRLKSSLRQVALLVFVAACAPIPVIAFVAEDGGTPGGDGGVLPPAGDGSAGGVDAGRMPSSDAMGATDASIEDASAPEDAGDAASDDSSIDPSDDAGPDASFVCGTTTVSDCTFCPGATLRCRKGQKNTCVSDCTGCATASLPCFHCATPDAAPRGTCLPVNANGVVACTETNLCACNAPSDCPVVVGAAQICDNSTSKGRCITCGSAGTDDASCASAAGTAGVCIITDGGAPACE